MKRFLALAVIAGIMAFVGCDLLSTAKPTVAIVYPENNDTVGIGSITIKATATDDNGSVTQVEFFDGSTSIGVDNSGTSDTFAVVWASTAGAHTLKATATNDAGKTASHSINVTVSTGGTSGPTHHSGEIDTNEVWYPTGNPHIIDDDVYTGDDVTLTIMPGCYIQFAADAELSCGYSAPGSIIAVGKADSMITFTSLSDTVPGFWRNIVFWGNTMSTARMSYCNVIFAGKTADNYGAVRLEGANIKFDHNTVRKSGSNGLWVTPTGYFTDFTNNTITGCTKYAVHIGAAHVPTLGVGNVLTGNTKDGIQVDGMTITETGTWLNHDVPYVVTDDIDVGDETNSPTLTIEAGCTIALSADVEISCGYSAPGSIIAVGTASSPITFTSASDTVAGFWKNIVFWGNTMSTARMSYCNVLFGGKTTDNYGAVRLEGANIKFDHNTVRKSGSNGLWVTPTGYFTDFTNNTITGCTKYAVHIGAAHVPTLGVGNVLTGNTKDGIEVDGMAVTETGTWLNHGVPYFVTDDIDIGNATNNPVLTIAAGTTVKLNIQTNITVGYSAPGGLICDGTAGRITFTSSVSSPSAGDWYGLYFWGNSMSSQCQLKNCTIEYGGRDYGNIYINSCTPTVNNCDIGYSSNYGIYLTGSPVPDPAQLRADNTIHDYVDGDIHEP